MSKHTPGPWGLWVSDSTGAFEIRAGDGDEGAVLATRAPWHHRAAESAANARLIAAAPDLLEAAIWAHSEMRGRMDMYEVRSALDAAITKAEGEE